MNFPLILFSAVVLTGVIYVWDKISRLPKWMNDYLGSFFPVLLIVFVLRSFIAEPFRIPSGSMLPTLHIGDFILVNKYSYGIRLPVANKKVLPVSTPERGDVVVFRYPKDESINFIKRLIGLPGDQIEYQNKRLTINGEQVDVEKVGEFSGLEAGEPGLLAEMLTEQFPDNTHNILWDEGGHTGELSFTVPEGQYFVMGDNRDHSNDSRYWGFVDDELLVGKAFFIWFNYNEGEINWGRIGDSII